MTENNQNDEVQENRTYDAQVAELAADMSDDENSDDLQENEFLFPPINPHYRNDLE
jgi:hypothetical protein